MKNYSRANVVELEMKYRAETSILKKIAYAAMRAVNPNLLIKVPASLFYRADIFCKDVERKSEYEFSQYDLLDILFEDFIHFISTSNSKDVYGVLANLEKNPVVIKHYSNDYEVNSKLIDQYHHKFEELYYKCDRDDIERVEVLLYDIAELYPDHTLTVERAIELLYCDFVEKLKNSNNKAAVSSMVTMLNKGGNN